MFLAATPFFKKKKKTFIPFLSWFFIVLQSLPLKKSFPIWGVSQSIVCPYQAKFMKGQILTLFLATPFLKKINIYSIFEVVLHRLAVIKFFLPVCGNKLERLSLAGNIVGRTDSYSIYCDTFFKKTFILFLRWFFIVFQMLILNMF